MPHVATVSRVMDAPPGRVWRSLASDELAAWFWPPRFGTRAAVEPRVGGAFRIRSDAMGMGVSGEVVEVVPGERLLVAWRWDGEDGETLVAIDVAPDLDGSRVTVVHEGFATADAAAEHATGWQDCLDRLPAYLEATRTT